ncbi:MAG: hypothetical protein ACWGNV_00625 [Bacteroidales bacterium]
MKVHMVCETPFGMKGNGVYTACVDSLELLREKGDMEVVVNKEGKRLSSPLIGQFDKNAIRDRWLKIYHSLVIN